MKVLLILLTVFLSYKWIKGVEKMKDLHPEYTGEDFP